MAFKKLSETQSRTTRRWALVGFPADGKSSFAAQMETPILPIDVDGRFKEVEHLANGDVLAISDKREDNSDVQAIDRLLAENMPDSGVKTIVVDSVTPIFQRITRRHQVEEHEGTLKGNKSAIHREKADVMALLGTSVTAYGTDVLFIWHLHETTFNGSKKVGQSVSETERERLRKFLSAELHVVFDKEGRRGLYVAWARLGFGEGQTVWDAPENAAAGTYWKGIPEKLDALLSARPVAKKAAPATNAAPSAPSSASPEETGSARHFASSDEALNWGASELGLPIEEVTVIYGGVKAAKKPSTAKDMWAAWVSEVETRKADLAAKAF